MSKNGASYNYGAQSASCPAGALDKAHAAVAAGGNSYCYDQNGNMVRRVIGGVTYTLTYDAENHLTGYSGGSVNASFVYDGDGRCVRATVNGDTTTFVGNYVEWQSSANDMVRYYYAGGVRLAMHSGADDLVWLVGDHLGSTSIAVNNSSGQTERQGYKAWGETRFGDLPTNYRYTGQYEQPEIGLYYYNARWYDPALSRWAQPDSIIPDQYNPLDWDRYSFVRNNPTRYTDPDGHRPCDEERGCGEPVDEFQLKLGRAFEGEWDPEKQEAYQELIKNYAALLKLLASFLWEPVDWIITIGDCAEGNCSGWVLLGLLPLVPGSLGDELGEGLIRLIRSDQYGTSQVFKLRAGEDGLSVFANVLPQEVLKEFPGLSVPNTTIIIPVNGLPPGTSILKTLGIGMSDYLANAHYILIRPEGWSIDRFAKFLKHLVVFSLNSEINLPKFDTETA